MIEVSITNLTNQRADERFLNKVVRNVFKRLKIFEDAEVSIVITDKKKMSQLNEVYKKEKGSTDVLSFEIDSKNGVCTMGEIVICVDETERQMESSGLSQKEVMGNLLIHGLLHLFGYNHENVPRNKGKLMFKKQKELFEGIILN
ncbi:MAG: hypothetical protein ACD_63C00210G0002 [uncultured bacterium]|nr:MAG: hypothetical protein ACD_63C00210G0002 [uncultured bacterium]